MTQITFGCLFAGEAAIASANFTVEKSSGRIEVADAFTLYRNTVAKPGPAAGATAGKPAADKLPESGRVSRSTQESTESVVATRPPDGTPPNTLRLTLHPAGAGTYPSKVVLCSSGDVRVLDVEFAAVKTGQQVTLEFNTPARERLVQEVSDCSTL